MMIYYYKIDAKKHQIGEADNIALIYLKFIYLYYEFLLCFP